MTLRKGTPRAKAYSQVGRRIDRRLDELELTRQDLARHMGEPPTTVNQRIRDASDFGAVWLTKVAKYLETDLGWLLTGRS